MKNLMDFCIGTCTFILLGFGLLLGEDALGGFIGIPTLGFFTDYANFDWSNFVFNLVFCATQVMGWGIQKGVGEKYRGVEMDATLLPKIKVEVIVSKIPVADVIEAAKKALYTGYMGDGKIFVCNVQNVVKVRTGEEGIAALQDVE